MNEKYKWIEEGRCGSSWLDQTWSMLLKCVDGKTNCLLKVRVSSDESGKKSVRGYQYSGRSSSVGRFRLEETGGEEGGEDTERLGLAKLDKDRLDLCRTN